MDAEACTRLRDISSSLKFVEVAEYTSNISLNLKCEKIVTFAVLAVTCYAGFWTAVSCMKLSTSYNGMS